MIIDIRGGRGNSGGCLVIPFAQKQYFPKNIFIPKMSLGRSCVKLNYFSLSRAPLFFPLLCSTHFHDAAALSSCT